MAVVITSFTAGSGDEITVGFELCDGSEQSSVKHTIPISVYTELGLAKGECSTELYCRVAREAGIHAAFKRGGYILGFGACSVNMLVSKLISKGFERADARAAVERMQERGFIDEYENAAREAEKCAEKLWGESRIRAELARKRYDSEAIAQALYSLEDSGLDFDENCKKLIASRYAEIPSDRAQMQKLVAAVCRMGYSISQIKSACSLLLAEQKRPDPYK